MGLCTSLIPCPAGIPCIAGIPCGSSEEVDGDGEEEDVTEEEIACIAQEKGFRISDFQGLFSNIAQQMVDEDLDV
jgi:hypothetical protein